MTDLDARESESLAAPLDASTLPEMAIAGPVGSGEERVRVQQAALITRRMRFFTSMTKPSSPSHPRKIEAPAAIRPLVGGARYSGPYNGPPYYPPHHCMWCGIAIEDPGAGFIDHAKASRDCFIQWQDFRDNMKREAGGT